MRTLVISSALALLLVTGTAFAANTTGVTNPPPTPPHIIVTYPEPTPAQGPIMTPPHIIASSTYPRPPHVGSTTYPWPPQVGSTTYPWPPRMGSTTYPLPPLWFGTSTLPFQRLPGLLPINGLNGTVSTVGTSSFTMQWPAVPHRFATTTVTINVTASTMYTGFISATTTKASFADILVGEHVIVAGNVSTSTMSITATRIHILDMRHQPVHPGSESGLGGILNRLRDLLGLGSSSGSAAAVEGNSGFLGSLFHTLFGWL